MLILQVMERDHNHIKYLLSNIKNQEDDIVDNNINLVLPLIQEFINELREAQEAEHDVVYKAISDVTNNNIELVHLIEEHHVLNRILKDSLNNFEDDNIAKGFAQFCIMENLLNSHFEFEENFIYQALQNTFSEKELDAIGEAYELKRIQASPMHYYV